MKSSLEVLRSLYNDKETLKKIRKAVAQYRLNQKSMETLKQDARDMETHLKAEFNLKPAVFRKIVKASEASYDNFDQELDEMQLIHDIAKED